jgi:DNA-binding MarR family transcriptional regulator/GNAT superfamily N-acetyltransferase
VSSSIDVVPAVRAFNRFYTNRIGVLHSGLLDTAYSLTEARILFELAQSGAVEVTQLRRGLDIDPGYLSRILRRFEAVGLVVRQRSATDARRQVIRLTAQGAAAFNDLDTRSAAQIRDLLSGVGEADRRRLVGAMRTIQEILAESGRPASFLLRPLAPGDLGWVVQRHGALYAEEYGWDASFEALVARIVADYAQHHDPRRENAWIAEVDGQPVGCVFCVRRDDETAQLRLLLVEPGARGGGIGRRLVDECVRFATRAGYRTIVLWTNDVLVDARRIYERAGFELVSEEKHHSFGHDLVGQYWQRGLQRG